MKVYAHGRKPYFYLWCAYCAVLMLWFVVDSAPTQAADFNVSTLAELIAAINTANQDVAADRIILNADIAVPSRAPLPAPADATITLIQNNFNFHGGAAFPPIYTDITIIGNGFTLNRTPACVLGTASDNNFRFFYVETRGAYTGILALQNLTLTNGCANSLTGGGNRRDGGAIMARDTGTTLTLNVVTFSNNRASGMGGGIYSTNGADINIINTTYTNNSAGDSGGAFFGSDGALVVRDSSFVSNGTGNGAGAINSDMTTTDISTSHFRNNNGGDNDGGAVRLRNGGMITASVFENNEAGFVGSFGGSGGALRIAGGDVFIKNSIFRNNRSTSDFANGGAIYVASDAGSVNLSISDTLFEGNRLFTGDRGGGAIFTESVTTFTIEGSAFIDNSVVHIAIGVIPYGGAIYTRDELSITNTTFSGNRVLGSQGNALYVDSDTRLNHVTMVDHNGMALYNDNASVTVDYSLFDDTSDCLNDGGTFTTTGNFAEVGDPCNNLGLPTNLGVLADNGGITPTVALLAGSNAIDAATGSGMVIDQRRVIRTGDRDAGAFEAIAEAPTTVSFTSASQTVGESDSFFDVEMNTTNPAGAARLIAFYMRITGTAARNEDYLIPISPPNFYANYIPASFNGNINITVLPIDNDFCDGDKTLTLALFSLNSHTQIVGIDTHTITLTDNDTGCTSVVASAPAGALVSAGVPSEWSIDVTVTPPFAGLNDVVIYTVTIRKLAGGTLINMHDVLPNTLQPLGVTSNRGAVSLNGQTVMFDDDMHVGDVAVIDITARIHPEAGLPFLITNTACIITPVNLCDSATLVSVQQLPSTGETPSWAVFMRQFLGLE